jgi:hypothetical protein
VHRTLDQIKDLLSEEVMACKKCFQVPKSRDDCTIRFERKLFSSSHLDYSLCFCPNCNQAFLLCFDEEVDWEKGNDRMWSIYTAMTDAEVAMINLLPQDQCDQGVHNELLHRTGVFNPAIVLGPDNQWKGRRLELPWPTRSDG